MSDDGDCDGILFPGDCDDDDPESTTRATDSDCDGVETADDCDDLDIELGDSAFDGDCDGTLTDDDCDDSNPDLSEADLDDDGETSCGGDCDDLDPLIGSAECAEPEPGIPVVFTTTDSIQTWSVPSGVSLIEIDGCGA